MFTIKQYLKTHHILHQANLFLLFMLIYPLIGCSPILGINPSPSPTTIAIPTQTAVVRTMLPTSTPTDKTTLTIWLPPQFDPQSGTSGGKLLKNQLDEFIKRRPNVEIIVRIKAQEGPGGLLEILSATNTAAPLALPDLVALSRPQLEYAAKKGLLHAFDGLSRSMEDTDWYENARQLASVQNSFYGLPFSMDVLLMVYRSSEFDIPIQDNNSLLEKYLLLAIPAADPQALYPLALYLSAGGEIIDSQGKPILDAQVLGDVLDFLYRGRRNGVFPYWLSQYQSFQQSWQIYTEGQADQAIIWASDYLSNTETDTIPITMPVFDATPFTLSNGWLWAITSPESEKLNLTTELAEFLLDPNFIAIWCFETGYTPPRPSSLAEWKDPTLRMTLDLVARSATILPSNDILTVISPALSQATVKVIKDQADPRLTALEAVNSIMKP